MKVMEIEGGNPLEGKAQLPGAKNSVLPIMAASLLCEGRVQLQNVPLLTDVFAGAEILGSLGTEVVFEGKELFLQAGPMAKSALTRGQMESMRSSIFYLAPLLQRCGRAEIFHPGGCNLGPRPIDMHLQSLAAMGATYEKIDDSYILQAPNGLTGADITLRLPSVGTTETVLMAAVLAKNETVLRGAAREPEVVELAAFLNACGAEITGAGGPVITIKPVKKLTGGTYRVLGDRILASTLLCAVAAAGGDIIVDGVQYSSVAKLINILRLAGCEIESIGPSIHAVAAKPLEGSFRVDTKPFPGFATDAGPLLCAAFCKSAGNLQLQEMIFDNRFACAAGLQKLGAKIEVQGRRVDVAGQSALQGAEVQAEDLRGGAALVIAALAATGKTQIGSMQYVSRGYENMSGLLNSLGAKTMYIE